MGGGCRIRACLRSYGMVGEGVGVGGRGGGTGDVPFRVWKGQVV